jgi:hypothetical protein
MSAGADDVDLDPISALCDERALPAQRIADIDLRERVRAAFDAGVHDTETMAVPGLRTARDYQIQKVSRR